LHWKVNILRKLKNRVGAGLVPARINAGDDRHFALQNPGRDKPCPTQKRSKLSFQCTMHSQRQEQSLIY
jgi:hypothetical protein